MALPVLTHRRQINCGRGSGFSTLLQNWRNWGMVQATSFWLAGHPSFNISTHRLHRHHTLHSPKLQLHQLTRLLHPTHLQPLCHQHHFHPHYLFKKFPSQSTVKQSTQGKTNPCMSLICCTLTEPMRREGREKREVSLGCCRGDLRRVAIGIWIIWHPAIVDKKSSCRGPNGSEFVRFWNREREQRGWESEEIVVCCSRRLAAGVARLQGRPVDFHGRNLFSARGRSSSANPCAAAPRAVLL